MKKLLAFSLFAFAIASSAPASAQSQARESVYTPGGYWNVQAIHVEDGQFENYMDYISATYDRSQQFARRSGWITGYDILVNVNAREGEPDLYLVTRMARLATPQEEVERERRVHEHMSQTTREASQQSGQRVTMRRLGSSMLLQELDLRSAR